ncbi:hypothetical protein FQR65_LT06159 [Abscondita terminalis]|nr:hypothetical protein FQR65_LT06159 [Abscondita terminalis]
MEETHIDNYPPAVWVRNACKQYSAKKNPVVVLNHLNLTVPKGCIYGLLGASGCGKTTLLNCILNFKKIDSGKILIFGGIPGTEDSGVPGPLVGYMPQELALGPSFSIMESLKYYGWIAGLQNAEITQRTNVLAKLLVLPDLTSKIIYLSGGQQRRVSLACALIHQPQLLILDEPTVGLDSILRQEIWDYLQQLSKKMVTIIITTHYIEETRQADMVGFMRGGNILTEDSPDNVLRRFNEPTLEKVFLKLSIMQNFDQHELIVTDGNGNGIIDLDDVDAQSIEIKNNANFSKQEYFEKLNRIVNPHQLKRIRIKAQLWKHLLWMKQNHISVLFFILLGVSQVSFFCLTVGHNPSHVPVSVYNSESIDCREVSLKMECNSTKLSCVYLKYLENSIYKLVYHKSEKSALDSVSSGKTYATIIIKPDYSKALHNRINKWYFTSSSEIEQSEISVIRDNTNAEVSEYITLYLYKNFQTFLQNYLESCNFKKKFFAYPVKIEDAIYALNEPDFTEYFLPGFVVT